MGSVRRNPPEADAVLLNAHQILMLCYTVHRSTKNLLNVCCKYVYGLHFPLQTDGYRLNSAFWLHSSPSPNYYYSGPVSHAAILLHWLVARCCISAPIAWSLFDFMTLRPIQFYKTIVDAPGQCLPPPRHVLSVPPSDEQQIYVR